MALILVNGMTVAHAATGLTFHGRILQSNNTPVNSANVFFHIQIRSPGAEDCLLFDESQTLNMTGSNGVFVLTIGGGTRVAAGVDGGYSMERIFANKGTLTVPTCTFGGSYTPNIADGRELVVQFSDNGGPWQSLPIQNINFVPMAIEAIQVGGYKKDQLLRVADGVVATEFSGANWTALWDLITGNSSLYQKADGSNFAPTSDVDFNGQQIVDLADPTSAQDAATKNYVDTSLGGRVLDPIGVSNLAGNGRTLVWDQAQNKWVTGIPNDTSKLALSGGTMAGPINMGSYSVTNIGHVVIADQGTMFLGKFDAGQETTFLLSGLNNTSDRGRTWFNVDTGKMRYWDGTAAQDVASKAYVDSAVAAGVASAVASAGDLKADGSVAMSADWDVDGVGAGTRRFTGFAAPAVSDGVATKGYADSNWLGLPVAAPGAGEILKSVRWNAAGTAWEYYTPFTASDLTQANVISALTYTPVNRAGDTMTGLLLLSADPSNAVGAATKQYVDAVSSAAAGAYVRIDGTTLLTADWDLNGLTVGGTRKIVGLDTPTVADGAANKAYVDAREAAAIVAANAYTDAEVAALDVDAQTYANTAESNAKTYADGKLATKNISVPVLAQDGQSIRWNNTSGNWEYFTASVSTGTVSTVTSANADIAITNNSTTPELTLNVGTGASQIVKLNASAELPSVSGVNLTNLNASNLLSGTLPDARLSTNVALKTYVDAGDAAERTYVDGKLVTKNLAVPLLAQDGQSIRWNNTSNTWEYFAAGTGNGSVTNIATGTGLTGGPITGTGTISIAAGGVSATELSSDAVTTVKVLDANVTYAKIQNVTTNKLLGRATAGPGVMEEITLGSGLAFSGTTLNAVGSGGTVTQVTSANTDIGVATTTSTPLLTLNTGTGASQIVKLNASAELPSVSGVNLTALNASNIASGTLADARLSTNVALKAYTDANILGLPAAAPTGAQVGQAIRWNAAGTAWEYFTPGSGNGSVTSVTSANADLSIATTTTTPVITLNTGSGADQILKLNASAQIPAVDGSLVTNLSAANLTGTINDARLSTNVALKSYVDAGDAAERTYVDGKLVTKNLAVPVLAQDGQSIRWNNTSNAWEYFAAGTGNGSVTQVTSANGDATIATTTTTPLITINTGTGANQIVKLDGSSRLPALDASQLTAINASNISSGTVADARLSTNVAMKAYTDANILGLPVAAPAAGQVGQAIRWNAAGTAWEYFTPGSGNGSVTSVTSANTDASFATTTTTPVLTINTGVGANQIVKLNGSAELPALSGVNLTALNASNIASGTVADARLSTNVALKSYVDAGDAAERTYVDGKLVSKNLAVPVLAQDGQSIRWNNTSNAWEYFTAGSGSGTVSSVTSVNADIGITNTTTTPALTLNTGTGANQIVKLNASSELPALSGVNLTALNASSIVSGTLADARLSANVALKSYVDAGDLKLVTKDLAQPVAGDDLKVIRWNQTSGQFEYFAAANGTVTGVTSANSDIGVGGTAAAPILTLNSGTGSNQIVKLDGSSRLPAVDASQVTAINASSITSGTLPNARLTSSVALAPSAPVVGNNGQALRWNNGGSAWEYFTPGTGNGSVTNIATGTGLTGGPITGTGTISIAAGGVSATELASDAVTTVKVLDANVTYAKIQNVSATNRLLGRATAGAGVMEEITLGSGLSFTGTTLNASGSGGTVTSVTSANTDASVATTTTTPVITINTGTSASQIVKLDASARLPAVDASQVTAINASNISSGTLADARLSTNVALKAYTDANILGLPVAAPAAGQVGQAIRWNAGGTAWEYFTPGTGNGSVTQVTSANADIGVATTTSTPLLTLNTGTGANQILKLNASSQIPAVDGSLLTALNGSNVASGTVADARLSSNVALKNLDLSQFSVTSTSAQLATLLSNETGTGVAVFGTSPTITTPAIGTGFTVNGATSGSFTINAPATGASGTYVWPSGLPGSNRLLQSDAAGNLTWIAAGGGGDAFVSNPLSQFAATTSLQLANTLTNETGTGLAVFDTSPTITTPTIRGFTLGGSTSGGILMQVNATGAAGTYTWPDAAPASNMVLQSNASGALSWVAAATGTVTQVTSANTDIGIATTTTTPFLTLNTGTGANQIVKLDGSSRLPAVDASLLTAINASSISSGTLPNARLTSSVALAPTAPVVGNNGQALRWNNGGSAWEYFTPGTGNGSVTNIATGTGLTGGPITGTGTISIASGGVGATELASNSVTTVKVLDANVTYAKIQDVSTNNRLLGRATAGAGVLEEITLGTGLSLTGSTLNAAGSGGTVTAVSSANSDASVATGTTTPVITINTGTGNNQLVKLNASAELPAVSGVNLTNLNASNLASGSVNVARLTSSVAVAPTAPVVGNNAQALRWNNALTAWEYFTPGTGNGSVTQVTSANTDIGIATTTTTPLLTLNTGTGASQIVKLDASARLPAVDGSLVTSLNGSNIASGTVADARLSSNVALKSLKLDQFAATSSAELAATINDETGTGLLVYGTSPTMVTPTVRGYTLGGATSGGVNFSVAATGASGSYVWPAAAPASNMVLQSDNTGALSWVSAATGTGDFKADGTVPMSAPFEASTGSAALPSITFNGDENTGIYNYVADGLAITTNGADKVRFSNLGNITSASGAFVINAATTAGTPTYGFTASAGMGMYRAAADTLAFSTASTERMRIDASGNVGVGTTAPGIQTSAGRSYLTIKGATEPGALEFATGAADADNNIVGIVQYSDVNSVAADKRVAQIHAVLDGATANNRGGQLRFQTKANGASGLSSKMVIDQAGSVGIGTITPLAGSLLTVEGVTSLRAVAAPTLTANYGKIYVDSGDSNKLKYMNPAGSIVDLSAAGSATIADDSLNFDKLSDSLALDASTDVAADGAEVLSFTNGGSGNSLVVNDATGGDTTPFVIQDDGDVGIGVSAPTNRLHVVSANSWAGSFDITSTATNVTSNNGAPLLLRNLSATSGNYAGIQFYDANNNTQGSMGVKYGAHSANGQGTFYIEPRVVTSPTAFVVAPTGNVGIGTLTPDGRLTVIGDGTNYGVRSEVLTGGGAFQARISGKSNGWNLIPVTNGSYTDLQFGNYDAAVNGTKVTFSSAGNVGIGDNTPDAKLDVEGTLGLSGSTSGILTFAAPATVTSGSYVWPAATPASNMVLQSDNTGAMSWVAQSGGSPGGATTQVQFNNAGAFAGDADFVWNNTAKQLGLGVSPSADYRLDVVGNASTSYVARFTGGTWDDAVVGIRSATAAGIPSLLFSQPGTMDYQFFVSSGGSRDFYLNPGSNFNSPSVNSLIFSSAGQLGLGTNASPTLGARLDVAGTTAANSSIIIPRAATADRPVTGVNGMMRYNSTTNKFEAYQNNTWVDMIGGGTVADDSLNFDKFIDAMILDAATSITAPSGQAYALSVINEGTGASFRVNDAASDTTPFIVDADGNVGVGTSTPTPSVGGRSILQVYNTSGAELGVDSGTVNGALFVNATELGFKTSTNHPIAFSTNANEKARIAADGSFGIGTNNPTRKLEVAGSAQAPSANSSIAMVRSTDTQAADIGGSIGMGGSNGVSAVHFSLISGFKENSTSGNNAGYMGLYTRPAGGNLSERMRIDSTGNVGVGDTSPDALLDVQGTLGLSGSTSGTLTFAAPAIVTSGTYVWPAATPASNMVLQSSNTGVLSWVADGGSVADDSLNFDKFIDAMILDATTSITAPSGFAYALSVNNEGTGASFRVNDAASDSTPFIIDADGNVGVGTASPTSLLQTANSTTITSGTYESAKHALTVNPSAASTAVTSALMSTATYTSSSNNTTSMRGAELIATSTGGGVLSNAYGVMGGSTMTSSGTITNAVGVYGYAKNLSTGSIANARGGVFGITLESGGAITTGYGVTIDAPVDSGAGVLSTYYGLYMPTPTAASTNYAIYSLGGTNYFGGNVGIGTASPNQLLTVEGVTSLRSVAAPTATANYGKIYVDSGDSDKLKYMNPAGSIVDLSAAGTGTIADDSLDFAKFIDAMTLDATSTITAPSGQAYALNIVNEGTANSFFVGDQNADATPFVIDGSGNVGIGTAAPSVNFHVANGGMIFADRAGDNWYSAPEISFRRARNTESSPTVVQVGDSVGDFSFRAYDAGGVYGINAQFGAEIDGIPAGMSAPTAIVFRASSNRAASFTETMRISSSGNVGIGTTNPGTKLQVAGVITPSVDNTHDLGTVALRFKDIYAANNVIQTSDARLKTDIKDSDLGLDFINNLRPVSYYWKEGDPKLHYGVIAQETEKALSDAKKLSGRENEVDNVIVTHDESIDRYGVRYTELIAPIIKAIQELYNRLTGTEADIVTLKAKDAATDRSIASTDAKTAKLEAENKAKDQKIKKLEEENAAIKAYLCAKDKKAAICK